MHLGKKIKAIRLAEGLERKELSDLIGTPRATIRDYEQELRTPGGDMLIKITSHERFKKYTYWMMTDEVLPEAGQICPNFSILKLCEITEKKVFQKRA